MEQYWLMEERRMMWQRVRQGMLADAQAAVAESVEALRRASKAEWVAACEWNQFVMDWGDADQWVPKFKWRFKRDALETCWRLQGCADAQWALTRVVDALAHRAWEAYNIAEMEAEEAEVEAACADAEVRRLQEADGQAPAGGDAAGRRRRRRRRQVATTPPYPLPCQIAVPDYSILQPQGDARREPRECYADRRSNTNSTPRATAPKSASQINTITRVLGRVQHNM